MDPRINTYHFFWRYIKARAQAQLRVVRAVVDRLKRAVAGPQAVITGNVTVTADVRAEVRAILIARTQGQSNEYTNNEFKLFIIIGRKR